MILDDYLIIYDKIEDKIIIRNVVMRFLIVILLLLALDISDGLAQLDVPEVPPDHTVFLDMQVGSTGAGFGLLAFTTDRLVTGIFAEALFNETFYNIESGYITGFKAKFYGIPSPSGFYLGPTVGAHGYGRGVRPFAGGILGYDYYSDYLTQQKKTRLSFGMELKAGMDTKAHHFIGLSVSIGFGWNNWYVRDVLERW